MANPCVTCVVGCCHRHTVNISGYDTWVIARGLSLDPGQFLRAAPVGPGGRGFLLSPDGPRLQLTLVKRPTGAAFEPCLFLVELPDGTGRCGIYPLRPLICRTYPAYTRNGRVGRRDDVLCPDDAWRDGALAAPGWYADLARQLVEQDIYDLAVARWNYMVLHGSPDPPPGLVDYIEFLVQFYTRIEPARAALGDEGWQRLCVSWEACLDRGVSPLRAECPELAEWDETIAAISAAATEFFQEDLDRHMQAELEAWERGRSVGADGMQR